MHTQKFIFLAMNCVVLSVALTVPEILTSNSLIVANYNARIVSGTDIFKLTEILANIFIMFAFAIAVRYELNKQNNLNIFIIYLSFIIAFGAFMEIFFNNRYMILQNKFTGYYWCIISLYYTYDVLANRISNILLERWGKKLTKTLYTFLFEFHILKSCIYATLATIISEIFLCNFLHFWQWTTFSATKIDKHLFDMLNFRLPHTEIPAFSVIVYFFISQLFSSVKDALNYDE